MPNKILRHLWILLLLPASLLGCTGGDADGSVTASQTALPTATQVVETITLTPTLIPENTAVPTLSPQDAKAKLQILMKTNGDCKLPCIWGLTFDNWLVQNLPLFFKQFGNMTTSDIDISNDPPFNNFMAVIHESDLAIKVNLFVNDLLNETKRLELYAWSVYEITDGPLKGEEFTFGNPTFNEFIEYYILPQILITYGAPSQVLIYSFIEDGDPMLTDAFRYMLMVVYYEDQGFWIEYYMPREITENFYTGCPMKAHIYLTAEQSQDNFSFLEKRSNFNGIKYSYFFKSLEEATTLSLDEFYQVFKNPENSACIMTPKELWQLP